MGSARAWGLAGLPGDINQDGLLDPADLYGLRGFLGSAPSARPDHYVAPEHISPMP